MASESVKAFDAVRDYVAAHDFTQDETDKAILTYAGRYFRPFRPTGFDSVCVAGMLGGIGNEERQKDYEDILAVRPEQVREALLAHLDTAKVPFTDFYLGPTPCRGTVPVALS